MFFWAIWAADLGQRASGPGRTKYSSMGPCAIAARELCPIYFNLDVSALVYRGDCNLRLPLRLNLHCKTGLSWRVPSKLLAMARARAQRRRADHSACFGSHGVCARNAFIPRLRRPTACFDCPERYFEPKSPNKPKNPHHGVNAPKQTSRRSFPLLRVATVVLGTIA